MNIKYICKITLLTILSIMIFGGIHRFYVEKNSNFFDSDNIHNGAQDIVKMMGPYIIYNDEIYNFYKIEKETFEDDIFFKFINDMRLKNIDKIAFYFFDIDKLSLFQRHKIYKDIVEFMRDENYIIREIPADYLDGLFNIVINKLYLVEKINPV